MARKCAKSRCVSRPNPSAMFDGADRADRRMSWQKSRSAFAGILAVNANTCELQFVGELPAFKILVVLCDHVGSQAWYSKS